MIGMEDDSPLIKQAWMLAGRLERLSADSIWAHRASGARGALLKSLENLDSADSPDIPGELARLQAIVLWGFHLLEKAAEDLIK
jgi:hypothetical protein